MTCDHIVAYNGYTDFREATVKHSEIKDAVDNEKVILEEWLEDKEGRTDFIYLVAKDAFMSDDNRWVLSRGYRISKHCPECGEKIEWV
tara:strand:+ start:2313 stop:2576 length:264 start_codon:yes stop_codon:yes gene_type:complete